LLGPYWCARHEQPTLEARQLSERGGAFTVEVDEATVTVTGSAVTVAEGRCLLL
jgi:predicted PhzF superfamily epimerase YddE/YHI9